MLPTLLAAASTLPAGGELTSLFSSEALLALVTLTVLEVVLGVDNIIFISILSKKLGPERSDRARVVGLSMALGMRVLLLLSIAWVMSLTAAVPWLERWMAPMLGDARPFNWRDLILLLGGLFLIYKAVREIHDKLEGEEHTADSGAGRVSFAGVIAQILVMDLIFSLDSVITAVGMVQTAPGHQWVGLTIMIVAIVIAIGVMLAASGWIADFVERHPTVKILALALLVLIGMALVADATHRHIPKGYIYFSVAFAMAVEALNLKLRSSKTQAPVHLKQQLMTDRLPR